MQNLINRKCTDHNTSVGECGSRHGLERHPASVKTVCTDGIFLNPTQLYNTTTIQPENACYFVVNHHENNIIKARLSFLGISDPNYLVVDVMDYLYDGGCHGQLI